MLRGIGLLSEDDKTLHVTHYALCIRFAYIGRMCPSSLGGVMSKPARGRDQVSKDESRHHAGL